MRCSSSLFFLAVGSALAISQHQCIVENKEDLARLSDCGSSETIELCLGNIKATSEDAIEACFTEAGCSPSEASFATGRVIGHCEDDERMGDLRLRYRSNGDGAAAALTMPVEYIALKARATGDVRTAEACFTTSDVTTEKCDTVTNDGRTTTTNCRDEPTQASDCLPGFTCSLDNSGTNVCMALENELGVDGIIIAIIFGVAIIGGIGALTYMSIRDRKEQRRLAAKAEAVAVARAQTKKMRADQQTSGVLRKHREAAAAAEAAKSGGPDPFVDRA
jgi:hypothetical protein